VQVVNLNNGERFETYVIEGKQGEMCLNGPAARLGLIGDTVIVLAYGYIDPTKETLTPKIVHVDTNNRPLSA
jgi:aspartate 1-decarboxylase